MTSNNNSTIDNSNSSSGNSIWLPSSWTTTSSSSSEASKRCSYVLGIDFGTSNSVMAIWRGDKGRVKIIKNHLAEKTTPSKITFLQDFAHYVIGKHSSTTGSGDGPDSLSNISCTHSINAIKTLLGAEKKDRFFTHFSNLLEEVADEEHSHHIEVVKKVMVICEDMHERKKTFSPEELIALILSYLRTCAVTYLQKKPIKDGKEVDEDVTALHRVVLGIPAHFTEKQKDCLRHAASMAGFDEIHFLVESTAAAMAYGLLVAGSKYVLVFDIGGGTLDITILHIEHGKYQVLYTGGHSSLGGQYFDQALLQLVQEKLLKILKKKGITNVTSVELSQLPCRNLLLEESRKCKEALSTMEGYDIVLSKAHFEQMKLHGVIEQLGWKTSTTTSSSSSSDRNASEANKESIKIHIHRDEFLEACKSLLMLIQETTYHVITQCRQQQDKEGLVDHHHFTIDEIVLVGGSSRIPQVQQQIRIACSKAKITAFANDNLDHKEFCTSISPEYAVAEGLAIRGAILRGEDSEQLRNMLMLDCLPTTIGILSHEFSEDGKGSKYFEPIVLQGSKLPVEVKKQFYLEKSNQRFVSLDIYEEVEEMTWNSSTESVESKFKYQVLVTVDVPIIKVDQWDEEKKNDDGKTLMRVVEVIFKVDAEGQLSYDVMEVSSSSSPTSHAILSSKSSSSSVTSSQQSKLLILYIVLLAVVYLVMKYLFPSETALQAASEEATSTIDAATMESLVDNEDILANITNNVMNEL